MIVLDASLIIALILREDNVEAHAAIYDVLYDEPVSVPAHWPAEIANSLWANQRRGRISSDGLNTIVEHLFRFKPRVDSAPSLNRFVSLVQFAKRENLTAYDAIYVQLALTLNASLATMDAEMRACAKRLSIPLIPA